MSSSSANSGFIVPPGQHPPFAVVSDTDHAAWIILATAIGMSCALIFGGIRVLVRCTISPGVGPDDALLAVSTVIALIQSCVMLAACADGLGKSIELVPVAVHDKIQQLYYGSTLLFIFGLALSKMSVVFFLRRLSRARNHRRAFNAAAVLILVWMVGSVFAVALQCNLAHPWVVIGGHCSGAFLRWQIISALDIVSEISLFALSIYLVWDLRTTVSKKGIVVSAFAFRLVMIIPIAFRLSSFDSTGRSTNLTLLEDVFICWTQTELNYSLISATIPALRPFVSNLNTQLGGLGEASGYGYGSASGTKAQTYGSYPMSNLKSADQSNTGEEDATTDDKRVYAGNPNTYSYGIQNNSTSVDVKNGITGGKRNAAKLGTSGEEIASGDATSVDSNDSRQYIIRKDVTWEVEQEVHAS